MLIGMLSIRSDEVRHSFLKSILNFHYDGLLDHVLFAFQQTVYVET